MKTKGFSLIELLTSIAILAIVFTLLTVVCCQSMRRIKRHAVAKYEQYNQKLEWWIADDPNAESMLYKKIVDAWQIQALTGRFPTENFNINGHSSLR